MPTIAPSITSVIGLDTNPIDKTAFRNYFVAIESIFAGSGIIRVSAGAPGAGLGVDGDICVDTTNGRLYAAKAAGAWGGYTSLVGAPGSNGSPGTNGTNGVNAGYAYTFDTATAMSAPAAGALRANNATFASVTLLAINVTSADGATLAAAIGTWDGSTTTANRGRLLIKKISAPSNFFEYSISGASTNNTTWYQLAVTPIASNGTIAASDAISIEWRRTGDAGAGAGSVTSITAGSGLSAGGVGAVGGAITGAGTFTVVEAVNAQTGTTYTYVAADHTKLIVRSNAAAMADTLPQATTTFGAGFVFEVVNNGPGVLTITPTTSTIAGQTSLVLSRGDGARLVSDGTNWQLADGPGLRVPSSSVASAATTDIGSAASNRVLISGTTTITSFGTVANQIRFVTLSGALTLTHNATSLILPNGGANIAGAAGDSFTAISDASGNWRVLNYQRADGTALALPTSVVQNNATSAISKGYTLTPNNLGSLSTGTTTLDPTQGNYQYLTLTGSITIAAPSADCAIDVLVTMGAGATAITMSGFTVGASTGSTLTFTSTHKFVLSIRRINGVSTYSWYALQ